MIKTILPKISFAFLLLLVFNMALFKGLVPITVVLFAFSSLVLAIVNREFHILNKKVFIIGISFFLIHLISVFYSDNKPVAWFDIEVKLSLLLFPLIFIVKNDIITKYRKYVFIVFAIGVVIANIYMLTTTLMTYNGKWWFLYSSYLSKYIHPSYIAMYNLFSMSILVLYFSDIKNKLRYLLFIPIAFLTGMIYLFTSKAGLLASAVVILYFSFILFMRIKNKVIKLVFPILLIISITYVVSTNFRIQKMVKSIVEIVQSGELDESSTGTRIGIWEAAVNVVSENFVIGVGAGDIKAELYSKMDKMGIVNEEANEKHYNVHNQYLETLMGQGIIGFVLLIALFIIALKYAYHNKDHILAIFIIIISLNFFPEAMLNNLHGVVFFALFYYFYMLVPNSNNDI